MPIATKTSATLLGAALLAGVTTTAAQAWGGQGHRLVALVAAAHLTPQARQNVTWLLGPETLVGVSLWADRYREDNYQTSYWHFLNIPPQATSYDRDRDCPRQPTVAAGSSADKWRDCAVDRILYNRARLADRSLDRADRTIALKFLVHLVGDIHQPFHVLGVERGGNGIPVSAFGSENCSEDSAHPYPCNLHSVWDITLIAHRSLDDRQYVAVLDEKIRRNGWDRRAPGVPADWAMQSHGLAKAALLPAHANVSQAYYDTQLPVIDERLALAGLRLAALLNDSLSTPPPATR
jgi:hypothetical protein